MKGMFKSFATSLLVSATGVLSSVALAEPAVERLTTRSGEKVELVLINHGSIAIRYKGENLYVDPADVDVAFFPVNQPYTMTPAHCANAVRTMKPKRVIPYHMGNTDLKLLDKELKSTGVPFTLYECLR